MELHLRALRALGGATVDTRIGAVLLLAGAGASVGIAEAEAFPAALRDGPEQTRDPPTTAPHFAFSETDHGGLEQRGQVLAVVKDAGWTPAGAPCELA